MEFLSVTTAGVKTFLHSAEIKVRLCSWYTDFCIILKRKWFPKENVKLPDRAFENQTAYFCLQEHIFHPDIVRSPFKQQCGWVCLTSLGAQSWCNTLLIKAFTSDFGLCPNKLMNEMTFNAPAVPKAYRYNRSHMSWEVHHIWLHMTWFPDSVSHLQLKLQTLHLHTNSLPRVTSMITRLRFRQWQKYRLDFAQ